MTFHNCVHERMDDWWHGHLRSQTFDPKLLDIMKRGHRCEVLHIPWCQTAAAGKFLLEDVVAWEKWQGMHTTRKKRQLIA